MFFHLRTATAVWRQGTTQFIKNPRSSSFNWSLRLSIILQIKELYYFLCIIEIVLNVSKHMIRKWDLLNEQEITLQFRQFQWAFFLSGKKKKKRRKEKRKKQLMLHSFISWPVPYIPPYPPPSPPWFWNRSVCWCWAVIFTNTNQASVGSGLGVGVRMADD